MVKRPVRSRLLAGVVVAVLVSVVVLVVAAETTWLDAALAIGRHQAAGSDLAVLTLDGAHPTTLTHDLS